MVPVFAINADQGLIERTALQKMQLMQKAGLIAQPGRYHSMGVTG